MQASLPPLTTTALHATLPRCPSMSSAALDGQQSWIFWSSCFEAFDILLNSNQGVITLKMVSPVLLHLLFEK